MQEEVNDKTISVCVKGGKITAEILKKALEKTLDEMKKEKQKAKAKHQQNKAVPKRGKTTLKKMMQEGSQISNIQITDNNIKSFERIARKYSIDYSLKKDKSTEPPRYLVFFRAKDVDVMTAAFKEYTGASLKKEQKVSVRKKLQLVIQRIAQRERGRDKDRERGPERCAIKSEAL